MKFQFLKSEAQKAINLRNKKKQDKISLTKLKHKSDPKDVGQQCRN